MCRLEWMLNGPWLDLDRTIEQAANEIIHSLLGVL